MCTTDVKMNLLNTLKESYPGRESQIDLLHGLLCYRDEPLVDTIFIHGDCSVGKSSVLESTLKAFQVKHAILNLLECYTPRILFESLLNKLVNHKLDPRNGGRPFAKCDNMMDFLYSLKKSAVDHDVEPNVIVLDKAENFRSMNPNLLSAFLRFRELCQLNVCVVLVSDVPFQNYYFNTNFVEPIKIHFPQYNKQELEKILCLDFDRVKQHVGNSSVGDFAIDLDFYKTYLGVFLHVFYRPCRNLSELRHMARLNFARYCEPVFRGECGASNSTVLWRHVSPILKASLDNLYLRMSSTHDLYNELPELPHYTKYLLIAAYLASYNPAKEDKRLFKKYCAKKKKTMSDVKMKSKVSEKLRTQLGPKSFSLNRLLAIFKAILDHKVKIYDDLLMQVTSLVEKHLLGQVSDESNLDNPRYKCTVNFDFIQLLSKSVGFNVRKYLSDFSHV